MRRITQLTIVANIVLFATRSTVVNSGVWMRRHLDGRNATLCH